MNSGCGQGQTGPWQPALEVAQGRHPLYVPAQDGTPVARFDLAPSLAARSASRPSSRSSFRSCR